MPFVEFEFPNSWDRFLKEAESTSIALDLLQPNTQAIVQAHYGRYDRAIKGLARQYGGREFIPQIIEEKLLDQLVRDYPNTEVALDRLKSLEEALINTGFG